MNLPVSTLGRTGVTGSKLGYGAVDRRGRRLDAGDVDGRLNTVLDAGTTMIDTSPFRGRLRGPAR